ncbi:MULTISPECIES: DUF1778 domain-containing protein [Gallibacterium]|uniref:DUF1778 domain-containing protein n=1 Tax=Gallibacterium genomosp. 3 TaxID=505345 RepID=A0A1A7NWW7_9PAST|nr:MULTISPECIES: DUF1778 domain-containing protein [Gallibacterium]MDA3978270.1 DUF1778 domain-containing protein [Gallibacterium sp. AGMB14963]OBW93996.1 hypothetical protein QV01_00365 [Gallibacterium genomosp. 3]OBX05452.1 hypothetical protein QV06_02165 [Gallibacterium genomosp. 3]
MKKTTKARLEAKVNVELYELFKQAAAITGRSLTDFVVDVVYQASVKTISQHQSLMLSIQDQKLLVDALNADTDFNASMQEAMDMHNAFLSQKQ